MQVGGDIPSRVPDCLAGVAPLETPSVTDKLKVYFKGRGEGEGGHWGKQVEGRKKADKFQPAAFKIIQGLQQRCGSVGKDFKIGPVLSLSFGHFLVDLAQMVEISKSDFLDLKKCSRNNSFSGSFEEGMREHTAEISATQAIKEIEIFAICNSMDGPGGNSAK